MKQFHIGIAGCGPAGLSIALFLHRQGHRITLVDQLEKPQPIGSGLVLQPTGLAVLASLGLEDEIRALGVQIDRMLGHAHPSGRRVLDVRYDWARPGRHGLAVHRAAIFNVLFEAVVRAGIEVVTGATVTGVREGAEQCPTLETAAGRPVGPFDLVIDALGSRSSIRQQVWPQHRMRELPFGALWASLATNGGASVSGFSTSTLEQVYARSSKMVGVLPIGQVTSSSSTYTAFFWSLKQQAFDAWQAGGLDVWKEQVLALWPETEGLLSLITNVDDLTFARYGHHTLMTPHKGRVVFIGDAAHATSPQLGQGVNMALLDAHALDRAFAVAADAEQAFKLYARSRRLHLRFYQAASHVFTPVYQSDSRLLPWLRDRFFVPATKLPFVPTLLGHTVGGTLVPPGIETA
ncbi:MAG: FAD-dependent monooxygenase [Rhodobiaceae bacterium]|nr:FAD-dependent monooxygenase [Rhodobiaceae bacterium]